MVNMGRSKLKSCIVGFYGGQIGDTALDGKIFFNLRFRQLPLQAIMLIAKTPSEAETKAANDAQYRYDPLPLIYFASF